MKRLAILTSALLASTAAHAYTITISSVLPPPDYMFGAYATDAFVTENFSTPLGTFSLDNSAVMDAGMTIPGQAVAPNNHGAYIASYSGVTLNLNAATAHDATGVSFLWATDDAYNIFSVGGLVINGEAIAPFTADPTLVTGANRDVMVTIAGLAPFSEMTWTNSLATSQDPFAGPQYSFEFNNVSVLHSTGATPELSTWVMMLAGFAFLGYAALDKRARAKVVA